MAPSESAMMNGEITKKSWRASGVSHADKHAWFVAHHQGCAWRTPLFALLSRGRLGRLRLVHML